MNKCKMNKVTMLLREMKNLKMNLIIKLKIIKPKNSRGQIFRNRKTRKMNQGQIAKPNLKSQKIKKVIIGLKIGQDQSKLETILSKNKLLKLLKCYF